MPPDVTPSPRSDRTTVTPTRVAVILTAIVVALVNAGGLASVPLVRTGLLWPVYIALGLGGLALAATTRRWRSPAAWGFVLVWVVLWAWMPYALRVAPDAGLATREAGQLGFCAVLGCAALLAGLRGGLGGARAGWLAGLCIVAPIAVWELTTRQHLWVTPARPFPFPEPIAVATYQNPNNFGIVLLSMLVALTAWRHDRRGPLTRVAATIGSLVAAALVLASESRAALLGLVVLVALEVRRRAKAHPGAVRARLRRHPRLTAGAATGVVAAIAASFLVPALARHNPVYQMLYAAIQPTTSTSDRIRLQLIGEALRQWRDSGYLGTGAGSFEPILWNDPTSPIRLELNLHNAFVELLSQYGVVVFVPFVALLAYLCLLAWRTRLSAAVRPRVGIVRTEMLGHLVVFTVLGITASSALSQPIWWIVLMNACLCGVVLRDVTRRPDPDAGAPVSRHHRAATEQARQSGHIAGSIGGGGTRRPTEQANADLV